MLCLEASPTGNEAAPDSLGPPTPIVVESSAAAKEPAAGARQRPARTPLEGQS